MVEQDDERGCRHRLVARSPLGAVAACADCGTVQLVLAQLSLRLSAADFRELAGLVAVAQRRLDPEQVFDDPTQAMLAASSVAVDRGVH